MATIIVRGLEIPDAGPAFVAALACHVGSGLACVVAGALAATARKRRGRHPMAGRVYLCGLVVVVVTAVVMAVLRWPHDLHLLLIAVVAGGLAYLGWRARRRRRPGWVRRHAAGLGGSYIALLTGFYVDNGPQLPVWDRLPAWTFWLLPSVLGIPLIVMALRRFAVGVSRTPAGAGRRGVRPRLR
jgi:hypothetical protein